MWLSDATKALLMPFQVQEVRDGFMTKAATSRADAKAYVKSQLLWTPTASHAPFVLGTEVCVDFFTSLYGISNNLVYAIKGSNKHAGAAVHR